MPTHAAQEHSSSTVALPVRPHLCNPAGTCHVVVGEPAKEVQAAVLLPAAVDLSFIMLVPLNGSAVGHPISCRKTSMCKGVACPFNLQLPAAATQASSLLLPLRVMRYSFTITVLQK